MTEYLHHMPGAMRVRTPLFHLESRESSQASRRLRSIPRTQPASEREGRRRDPLLRQPCDLGLELLQTLWRECPEATIPVVAPKPKRPARMTNRPIATEMGKKALGVLINTGVSYSLASLLRSPA